MIATTHTHSRTELRLFHLYLCRTRIVTKWYYPSSFFILTKYWQIVYLTFHKGNLQHGGRSNLLYVLQSSQLKGRMSPTISFNVQQLRISFCSRCWSRSRDASYPVTGTKRFVQQYFTTILLNNTIYICPIHTPNHELSMYVCCVCVFVYLSWQFVLI